MAKNVAKFTILVDEQGPRIEEFANRSRKAFDDAGKGATGFSDVLRTGVGTAVGFLAAQALPALKNALVDTIDRTAEVAALQNGFDNLTAAQGLNADVMIERLRPAMRGLVSDYDLMKATNNALTLGIVQSEEQWSDLSGAALKLGRAVGIDAGRALESLSIGLGRQSKLVLDNLGVIVDAEGAYERYAEKLGISTSALDDNQKKQAFLEEATKKIIETAEQAGEAHLTLGDRVDQGRAQMQNWIDGVLTGINESPRFNAALEDIAELFSENGDLASGFADALIRVVETGGAAAGIVANLTGKLVDLAKWTAENNSQLGFWAQFLDTELLANWTDMIGLNGESIAELNESMEANRQLHIDTGGEMVKNIGNYGKIIPLVKTYADTFGELEEQQLKVAGATEAWLLPIMSKHREQTANLIGETKNLAGSIGGLPLPIAQTGGALEYMEEQTGAVNTGTADLNITLGDFHGLMRTGNDLIDTGSEMALKLVDSLIGGNGLSVAFGEAEGGATSFFGKLQGFLGGGAGGLIGVGIGLLGGLIGKINFGPSKEEKQARGVYAGIQSQLTGILDSTELADAAGREWFKTNTAVNKIFAATGRSAAEAASMATRLVNSVRATPQEAQALADEMQKIMAEYQTAISEQASAAAEATKKAQKETVDEAIRMTESVAAATKKNVRDPLLATADEVQKAFDGLNLTRGIGAGLEIEIRQRQTEMGDGIPALAEGGIVRRPTIALIGEKRPEAVIPLPAGFASGGGAVLSLHVTGDDTAAAQFVRKMIDRSDVKIISATRSEAFE